MVVDVRLVVSRLSWDEFEVDVIQCSSYEQFVSAVSDLVDSRRMISKVFDFSGFGGVWPVSVIQDFFDAVTGVGFVERLAAGKVGVVGLEPVSLVVFEDGVTPWFVFSFQGRFFKVTGEKIYGRTVWGGLKSLVEVEETVVVPPVVTGWAVKG